MGYPMTPGLSYCIFERSKDHLVAFVAIAFISILARRLKRIVAEDFSAWHLQTDT